MSSAIRRPFCLGLNVLNNHMPSKVWDQIADPFQNFNGYTVEVWEWISNFITHFMMDVITYQYWD